MKDGLVTKNDLTPVIRIEDVCLTLRSGSSEVDVLRQVSLNVSRGQSVSLVGPSGSGKSTLMMVMAGLERPGSGIVAINGTDLSSLDEDRLARFRGEQMGIVFQSFHLIPTMTALENVAVPLEISGSEVPFEKAGFELEKVGLENRMSHYPSQLSGGEQQRVAIARALAPDPSVLFADEPTGNLDLVTGQAISDLIFERQNHNQLSLFLVTHDADLADRCDRTIRIADGSIVPGDSELAPIRPYLRVD